MNGFSKAHRIHRLARATGYVVAAATLLASAGVLAPASPAYASSGTYTFMSQNSSGPGRWDPCSAITWSATGPAKYTPALNFAFSKLTKATGISFRQVGAGAELLITVHSSSGSGVHGIGGPGHWLPVNGKTMYTSGRTEMWFGNQTTQLLTRKLAMHELGHVIGLGHVKNVQEVMSPHLGNRRDATYGPGDLAGLARLGRQAGCLTAIPDPGEA